MRTTKSAVTFDWPFVLNRESAELPAGSYDIETDEEEILTTERTAYRRTTVYFYVENRGSTRTLMIDPADLESALSRDAEMRAGLAMAESSAAIPSEGTSP